MWNGDSAWSNSNSFANGDSFGNKIHEASIWRMVSPWQIRLIN